MRKIFLDCGVREGDGIAAFLGDDKVGDGAYSRCLLPRNDSIEYEFIGFESPDYKFKEATKDRFANVQFTLIEKLVWTYDGYVDFDTDGESYDCRLLEVSRTEDALPWRHPNAAALVVQNPCIDLAGYIKRTFTPQDYLVLKFDIEGAEYEVLQRLISENLLPWLNELYVEYHWWGTASARAGIESTIRRHTHLYYRNDWP